VTFLEGKADDQACILYLYGFLRAKLIIDGGLFRCYPTDWGEWPFYFAMVDTGQLFYISSADVYIYNGPTFMNATIFSYQSFSEYFSFNQISFQNNGCAFKLINSYLEDQGGSTYSYLNCLQGGVFSLVNSKVNITGAKFDHILAQ
jgi:hypothetical protein